MSLIIPFTFGIRSTTATTGSDSLPASGGFSQDPTRRIAGNQFAIREADFRSTIRSLMRIFILKEHQEFEAAEALDFRHQRPHARASCRAYFALEQVLHEPTGLRCVGKASASIFSGCLTLLLMPLTILSASLRVELLREIDGLD
jgi:hypothetical protein